MALTQQNSLVYIAGRVDEIVEETDGDIEDYRGEFELILSVSLAKPLALKDHLVGCFRERGEKTGSSCKDEP